MPKGKGKGGKNRRRGQNQSQQKRDLQLKEDGQEYAVVRKMLGNGRLTAFCFDGKERQCHIRGKMRKKVWISKDDYILLGLRDFQDSKADVILKYNPDEVRELKARKEIPQETDANAQSGQQIVFAESSDEEDEDPQEHKVGIDDL